MTSFRRSENPIRDRRVIDPGGGGASLRRVILLADLESGDTVEAAVTTLQSTDEIQMVSLLGNVDGGTFTLTFDGETTGNIDFDADAATVKAALEALSNINSGDVIVSAYSGRWTVRFTGQYAGEDVPLMTATNNLTAGGEANDIEITSAFSWIDAGTTIDVHCQIPIGTTTPLRAGFVATVEKLQEGAGKYGIVNVECRDFDLTY